jgi:hypothetical protein
MTASRKPGWQALGQQESKRHVLGGVVKSMHGIMAASCF